MFWLYILTYLLMIPVNVFMIIKYRIDPGDLKLELWKEEERDTLLGLACIWPLMWVIFLFGIVANSGERLWKQATRIVADLLKPLYEANKRRE